MKKKIKKTLKKMKNYFTKMLAKFNNLPKATRMIIYTWCSILILLIFFIVATNINNNFLNEYSNYEKELKNAALDFMESENIYATSANKLRIDKEMLLDKGYLYIKDIPKEKECVGYALGFYDDSNNEYKAQAYLNCKHYTTKNYEK